MLSLKEDCLEFLEEERLKGLIKRYSEFINFPIYLYTSKEEVFSETEALLHL